MAYKEVENTAWKPENPEDKVEGILIAKESDVGENKSNLYTLESDGKPIAVWGSTVLDPKMVGIKVGQKIKIVYTGKGESKAGRNPPKLFKVYIDDVE